MKVIEQIKVVANATISAVSKMGHMLRRLKLGLIFALVGNMAVAAIIIFLVIPEMSRTSQVTPQETAAPQTSLRPVSRPDGFATHVAIMRALQEVHAAE